MHNKLRPYLLMTPLFLVQLAFLIGTINFLRAKQIHMWGSDPVEGSEHK